MADDPRSRTKTFIDTHVTDSNITKDDGTTEASWISKYADPNYPLERVFFSPKNVDGMYLIDTADSTAITDWKHETYSYEEKLPITANCVTKHGITGNKLRWKMEEELRSIVEDYPVPSVRRFNRLTPQDIRHGLFTVYSVQYNLEYKRAALDYTSDVTLSYGTGWNYDGDRVDGGTEGQWGDGGTTVDADGGSTVTQNINTNQGALTFNLTVFVGDAYSENATNLGLSTSIYTKIRFRYKTTGSAKAKIIVGDGAAYSQQVLSETASSTWAVGTVDLTAAKTLDHVALYICDGVGTVQYDFVQIYTKDFTYPNCVTLQFNPPSSNPEIGIPGRTPWITQNTGAPRAEVIMTCDLDMQTSDTAGASGCWKRTNDNDAGEVFLDVAHEHGDATPWEYLVFGNKSFKVTLDEPDFDYSRDNTVRLTFHEHSNRDTSDDSYSERWNIT
jgi:hypothetical protein